MFEIDFFSQSNDAIVERALEKLRTDIEDWEKQIWQFIVDWFNPAIISIDIFTSGSTGTPKQITHTKQAMLYSAAATCHALNLKQGNRALLCLPVNKIGGIMMVVRSIYNKMKLVCIKPSSKPFQALPTEPNIDFAAYTPMQFCEIISAFGSYKKAGSMRKIILGGEDLRLELSHFIVQLPNEVYATFGMTETISHIALKRINGENPDAGFKALPGINIKTDKRGCLIVEAPLLGQPYLTTNDVVSVIGENEFIWLGRIDNVINSGGVKIHPEEIEKQLMGSVYVPYFISSVPDTITGEKLILALEKPALSDAEKSELTVAFSKLEKLHRAKQILLIPKFAWTENGKIKRKESQLNAYQTIELAYSE